MYVIFPADEVVYLSYGRLIYVPQSPSLNTQVSQQSRTTATTSLEESPQSSSVPVLHKNTPTIQESRSVVPQVNQTASLDRKKLKNKPENIQITQGLNKGNKSRQSPEVSSVTKFHKRGSDSSKSISPPSTISILDEVEDKETNIRPRSVSESKQIEQSNKTPTLGGSLKVQKSIKERNPKLSVKSKIFKPEDPHLSSVFNGDSKIKERNEIPRSEIINTRSDQCQSEKTDKIRIKRENSFIRRIFNGQFSNSRTVVNDKSAVDFDSLFKRDKSTEKLSVSAPPTPSRFAESVRDSTGAQRNTQKLSEYHKNLGEKMLDTQNFHRNTFVRPLDFQQTQHLCLDMLYNNTNISDILFPKKKKSSTKLRIPRKPGREEKLYDADIRMAASETPLKDLIHPDYNEHFKSHNAVTFKLVRIDGTVRASTADDTTQNENPESIIQSRND